MKFLTVLFLTTSLLATGQAQADDGLSEESSSFVTNREESATQDQEKILISPAAFTSREEAKKTCLAEVERHDAYRIYEMYMSTCMNRYGYSFR